MGDALLLSPHHNFPRAIAAIVVSADKVRLHDLLPGDFTKLGLGPMDEDAFETREAARSAYWDRWDMANPDHPVASNPLVWRVEFRYGWPDDGPVAA